MSLSTTEPLLQTQTVIR